MLLTNRPTNVTLKGLITRILVTVLHVNIRIRISLRASDIITVLYRVLFESFYLFQFHVSRFRYLIMDVRSIVFPLCIYVHTHMI